MNVIERTNIFPATHRIHFLRIEVGDLGQVLKDIFQTLSDLSWISRFDEEYTRTGFQQRAKDTLESIAKKIETDQTDEVSSDAGEYIVSELAREAIIHELCYLDIPLAELYNKIRLLTTQKHN